MRYVRTNELSLTGLVKTTVMKVPVAVPAGYRAIPDSVSVEIDVEPLISKTLSVPVIGINVPDSFKVLPLPSTVEVYYMLPMGLYKKGATPKLSIEADYSRRSNGMLPLSLKGVPKEYTNAFMSADSVGYLIEHE